MGLRDFLRKKDGLGEGDAAYSETLHKLAGPEFTFIRSDTNTHEIIYPPSRPSSSRFLSAQEAGSSPSRPRRSFDKFRPRSRGNSASSGPGDSDGEVDSHGKKVHRPLSQRLGFRHRTPKTSEYVPEDLPQINVTGTPDVQASKEIKEAHELQWEKRATILATANEQQQRSRSTSTSVSPSVVGLAESLGNGPGGDSHSPSPKAGGPVSSETIDRDIQEAIRLHEEGDLERSTSLFERLADPDGANNPLSQVLYGLALRHGWGCKEDPQRAVMYFSAAASNAAAIENLALRAGMTKGGAAKGELVMAIFELANCFRHGWGITKDPVAAKQYYETAANLGDTDAMNETAWCYLHGFGCSKDKNGEDHDGEVSIVRELLRMHLRLSSSMSEGVLSGQTQT
ncbi:HCP-like protein [Xylariaceae sp. FL0594]|nr:HCP-like protein [Xylariaceae sp. FL0594]